MTRKICFFTVMTALFLLVAPNLRAAQSGTCGDNVTWTIDDDGVLTIKGTGAMYNYIFYSPAPWKDLSPTKAVIKDGVTTIGDYAFQGCAKLTSVTIPSSVTSIGTVAFSGCTGLESIIVAPENSTYDSRDNCNAIIETKTNILIAGCKNTTIPNSVTSIGNSAFASCSGLTSVTIPNSVTNIKYYAFANCTGLEKIESLAETPPTCGSDAFYNVDKKKCVLTVPRKSINAYKTATEWKDFTNINALAKGTCGDSVTWTLDDQGVLTIEGTGAMYDYSSESPSPWKDLSFTKAVIKEGVTTIGSSAFSGCTGLTSVTIPNSVTSIGVNAFSGCTGLTSVDIPNSVTSIENYVFYKCSGLTNIIIPNSVTSIGENAFSYCTGLTSVDIPNSVTSIGVGVFAGCSGLTSVDIPSSVTSIGENAFYYCTGLTSVTITGSVTSIGKKAFSYCTGLTSLTITGSVTSIGNWVFAYCTGLTSVTIPNSVTSIGESAFHGCSGLTSVDIPNSVTSIGGSAFYNCTGLTNVNIPASVTSIGGSTFAGCSGLESITVAPENSTYDSRDNCNAIIETKTNTLIAGCKNTTIPGSVTSIGVWAFCGCKGLTSLSIPGSVTSIGYEAFYGCLGLESIIIDPENSTYDSRDNCNAIIETKTNTLIAGCKNTTIPNTVTSIGNDAFFGCTGLTSLTIPNSVTSIGNWAFSYCSGLEKIESLAETPPVCGSGAFWEVDKNKCVLSVPEKSINAYKAAEGWKDFLQIISGIGGVAQESNAGVSARNGEITVTGVADNAVVEVYSTSGALVYRGASKTVSVPSAGIYIVKAAGRTFKVRIAR